MTPKKTIYVREEDQKIFEKAKELADQESLSQTIAKALKDLVERKKDEGFKEITLEVGTWLADETKQTEEIKFYGRELNRHEKTLDSSSKNKESQIIWRLFQGEKGKFLLYKKEVSSWIQFEDQSPLTDVQLRPQGKENSEAKYEIFDNLEELEEEKDLPNGFLQVARTEMEQEGVKRLEI